jgi:hypothetical protein
VIDARGVGGDVEAGALGDVHAERPDGREHAVVRRLLHREDVELGIEIEEARRRRAGPVARVRGRGDGRAPPVVPVGRRIGERRVGGPPSKGTVSVLTAVAAPVPGSMV